MHLRLPRRALLGFVAAPCALLATPVFAAPRVSVHVEAAAAHPAEGDKAAQFTWGGAALVAPELALHRVFGLELTLGALALAGREDAVTPTGVAPTEAGIAGFSTLGPRIRPLATLTDDATASPFAADGLWLAGGVGAGLTGAFVRPAIRAALGFDVMSSAFSAGPYVGYVHLVEPDEGSLRPEDARVVVFGLHGAILPATRRDVAAPTVPAAEPADADGDTIFDADDACDDSPEDFDFFEDEDGCPDLDNDRDGIVDREDACPNRAEDLDGFEDEDGCPEADPDEDGQPEIIEAEGPGVVATPTHIVTEEHIRFTTDGHAVTHESEPIVRAVAAFLIDHPEYAVVHVKGHADDVGEPAYNLRLSVARARAVRDALVKFGVAEGRLTMSAYGEAQPAVRGRSMHARAENRRVEFEIKERAR